MPSQPSFWTPGSPARNLSVTSLPRPALRKRAPGISRISGSPCGVLPSRRKRWMRKRAISASWILPRLWSRRVTSSKSPFGVDHAPGGEVVQRRAPQHGLLAAGVHGDVAADAGGVGRGRIDREHQPAGLRRLHHAPGHHAGAAADGRDRLRHARQPALLDLAQRIELLGIDDRRQAGSAAPRRRCSRCRRRAE